MGQSVEALTSGAALEARVESGLLGRNLQVNPCAHGVPSHSSSTHKCYKCAWLRIKTGNRTSSETKQGTGCLVNVQAETAIWPGDVLPGRAR